MGVWPLIVMRGFTLQGLMQMEEEEGWIKEEGRMAKERGSTEGMMTHLLNGGVEEEC